MNKIKLFKGMAKLGLSFFAFAFLMTIAFGIVYIVENDLSQKFALLLLPGFVLIVIPLVYFYGKKV